MPNCQAAFGDGVPQCENWCFRINEGAAAGVGGIFKGFAHICGDPSNKPVALCAWPLYRFHNAGEFGE